MSAKRVCHTPGCNQLAIARGLCRPCYYRWWVSRDDLSTRQQSHRQRNQVYRANHPDRVKTSTYRYSQSQKGKAARHRANARSTAFHAAIRFLNRETAEAIAQRYPFLQQNVEQIIQHRPLTRRSIRVILPTHQVNHLREAAASDALVH